jgi:cysteine desulfurase
VVRVTGNFTSESPLSEALHQNLLAAFDQGWADPKKLSQSAAKAAILRNQSLENIGSRLGIRPDCIEVLGEPALGHFLAIYGLLRPESQFIYSAIDKGKVRALSRSHPGLSTELAVSSSGLIGWDQTPPHTSVLSLQLANGETGVIQDAEPLVNNEALIAIDATTSGLNVALPSRWDTALFDARSWNGPAGLAILAINNNATYAYPLPKIAPIKSPGSYSLPLLITAAMALESYTVTKAELRHYLISELLQISEVTVIAPDSPALNHVLSFTVSQISGEHLVRELATKGIDIDSGSACNPADLQPSNVLAAMGYPTDGHLRATLHSGVTKEDIDQLIQALTQTIAALGG